jgi:NADH-ubiquinone oxidoreductase chain 2
MYTLITKKDKYSNSKSNTKHVKYENNLMDSLSPIQLINQLKGMFFVNPVLTISFTITIYSFIGIPPLVGFFAKQMILSAALDNGYIFMSLVAILTSVIGGVYYLSIIKELFFEKSNYISNDLNRLDTDNKNIFLSSSLTFSISLLTFIILFFIFIPKEILNITLILSLY